MSKLPQTLAGTYEKMEAARLTTFKLLAKYPDEKLAKPGPDGAWSVFQILNHLMMVERGVAMYGFKKAGQTQEAKPQTLGGSLKVFVAKTALNLPFTKFKAPDMMGQPDNAKSLKDVREDYDQARQMFHQMLLAFPADAMDKAVIKYPGAGPITLPQTLELLLAHYNRHHKQILGRLRQG
jgi:uncharacterized damage-inducible protein DinB